MAALGIAEGEVERGPAQINANRYAIANIASRYVGIIRNGVSQYAKNVNTRSGQKVKENELEGEAQAIGEKAIDKYADYVTDKTHVFAIYPVAYKDAIGKCKEESVVFESEEYLITEYKL